MLCEAARERIRRIRAYAAERCAALAQRYQSCRIHFYRRIAADDPPDHPARPPCTLKNWWSTAPPNHMLPAYTGEARAGPYPARRFAAKGGDG